MEGKTNKFKNLLYYLKKYLVILMDEKIQVKRMQKIDTLNLLTRLPKKTKQKIIWIKKQLSDVPQENKSKIWSSHKWFYF